MVIDVTGVLSVEAEGVMIQVARLQIKFGTEAVTDGAVGPVLIKDVAVGVLCFADVEKNLILHGTEESFRETGLSVERQEPAQEIPCPVRHVAFHLFHLAVNEARHGNEALLHPQAMLQGHEFRHIVGHDELFPYAMFGDEGTEGFVTHQCVPCGEDHVLPGVEINTRAYDVGLQRFPIVVGTELPVEMDTESGIRNTESGEIGKPAAELALCHYGSALDEERA